MACLCSKPFNLNKTSVFAVIGPSTKEVMVYGYEHAHYVLVSRVLGCLEKMVSYGYSDQGRPSPVTKRPLVQMTVQGSGVRPIHHCCKTAATALMVENYIRSVNQKPIVPLLFCVGSNRPGPNADQSPLKGDPPTVHSLTTKERVSNRLVTHSELRRIYKLCSEFTVSNDLSLRELSRVAQKTIRLVTVDKDPQSDEYVVHPSKPAWEEEGWAEAWRERTAQSKGSKKGDWRSVLEEQVHRADRVAEIDGTIKGKGTESVTKEVCRIVQILEARFGDDREPDLGMFQYHLSKTPAEAEKLRTMLGVSCDVAMADFLETQTLAEIYADATSVE